MVFPCRGRVDQALRFLVALSPSRDLFDQAKDLFVEALVCLSCGVTWVNEGGAKLGYGKTLLPVERPSLPWPQGSRCIGEREGVHQRADCL